MKSNGDETGFTQHRSGGECAAGASGRATGILVSLAALLVAGLLAGCGPSSMGPGIVASIGGEKVPYARFEEFLERVVGSEPAIDSAAMAALFGQFIEEELLFRLARDRRLVNDAALPPEAEGALLRAATAAEVSLADVETYYRDHRDEFVREETRLLKQLLVEERSQAEAVVAALRNGEAFDPVAKRFGGAAGPWELAREDLPDSFVGAIWGLEEGQWSPVLEAEGFHVFFVVGKRERGQQSLELAAPLIRKRLAQQWAEETIDQLLVEARRRYNVRVAEGSLPFTYP